MSQSYSSNCFSTANVIQDDMQNIENNFDALRSLFSGSSAPASPDAGQLWYDTGSSLIKVRYNSSWVPVWDMDGQAVAPGQVKTDSLAAGVLSTDSTGRGKMAPGYITSSHVDSIQSVKISDLARGVCFIMPLGVAGLTTALTWSSGADIYIPDTGAYKLRLGAVHYDTRTTDVGSGACPATHYIKVGSTQVVIGSVSSGVASSYSPSTYLTVTTCVGALTKIYIGTQGYNAGVVGYNSVGVTMVYITT